MRLLIAMVAIAMLTAVGCTPAETSKAPEAVKPSATMESPSGPLDAPAESAEPLPEWSHRKFVSLSDPCSPSPPVDRAMQSHQRQKIRAQDGHCLNSWKYFRVLGSSR
mgnify:CR=1 FL=1